MNEDLITKAKKIISKNKLPVRDPQQFLGQYPRRVYKAILEKVWMNADSEINGNYIDTRVEINLLSKG